MIDNILVGDLVDGVTYDDLGILPSEQSITIPTEEAKQMNWFLPKILVAAGLYKSTSEVKKISQTRKDQSKIADTNSRILWRTITEPELTEFKIGKKYFWLSVGVIK